MTDVLGLHRTSSRVSIDSITSFAGSIDTKKAYKRFCKDLYQIGVTSDMISQKKWEILNIFKSSQVDGSNITDQGQLSAVSDFSSLYIFVNKRNANINLVRFEPV